MTDSVMTPPPTAPMKMNREDIAQGLQWMKRPTEFDRDHMAIMLTCSREQYLWTSYDHLRRKCGLPEEVLDEQLQYLCKCGVLFIFVSEEEPQRRVLFALRERVEATKN